MDEGKEEEEEEEEGLTWCSRSMSLISLAK